MRWTFLLESKVEEIVLAKLVQANKDVSKHGKVSDNLHGDYSNVR